MKGDLDITMRDKSIDTTNLKSCPFCGYKAENSPFLINEKEFVNDGCFREYCLWKRLVCLKCKIKTREFETTEEVVEFWNERKKEDD